MGFRYLLACKCQNIVSNFPKISCLAFLVSKERKQLKLIVFILDFSFSGQKFTAEEQKIIREEKDINSS